LKILAANSRGTEPPQAASSTEPIRSLQNPDTLTTSGRLWSGVQVFPPTQIITIVKSITAREVFRKNPKVKEKLWGGEFWSDGYFVNTVSKFGDETNISKYVRDQGLEKEYVVLYQSKQLVLF
jgi:hypothetical protein